MRPVSIPGVVYVTPSRFLDGPKEAVTVVYVPQWVAVGSKHKFEVVTGCADGNVRLYRPLQPSCGNTVQPSIVFSRHTDIISSICSLPLRRTLFTASHDGLVCEWTADGQHIHTYQGHECAVLAVLSMSDELYSAGADGNILSWGYRKRALVHTFKGHTQAVTSLLQHGEKFIVSASRDGDVRVWVRKEGVAARVFRGNGEPITSAAVNVRDGIVYTATEPHPAGSFWEPDEAPTASEIKSRALRVAEKGQREHSCRSWSLQSGWELQHFPSDVTRLLMSSMGTQSPGTPVLVSGHSSGAVCAWLVQGQGAEAHKKQKTVDFLNARLDQLEEKLEVLRVAEEQSGNVLAAQKALRRVWYGLGLLLTSVSSRLDVLPGLRAVQASSHEPLAQPGQPAEPAYPGLRKLFTNSLGVNPELLWTGLVSLLRHCAAEENATAQEVKDEVDLVRRQIADTRSDAVDADRDLSAHLAEGQLLRRFGARGLRGPITCLAAAAGVVYAGDGTGSVWGWDIGTGTLRERLHESGGPLTNLVAFNSVLLGIRGDAAVLWGLRGLVPTADESPVPSPKRELQPVRMKADRQQEESVFAADHSADIVMPSCALVTDQRIRETFQKFDTDGNGRISMAEFWVFWESLDHCGVADRRQALQVLESARAHLKRRDIPAHTVSYRKEKDPHGLWGPETAGGRPAPMLPISNIDRPQKPKRRQKAGYSVDESISYEEFAQIMLRFAAR